MARDRTAQIHSETFGERWRLFRRVLSHFVPYKKRIVVGILCMIFASVFHVAGFGLIHPTLKVVFSSEKDLEQYLNKDNKPGKLDKLMPSRFKEIRSDLEKKFLGPIYERLVIPLRNRPWLAVIGLGVLMVAAITLRGIFMYTQEYLLKWSAYRMCADVRVKVYAHVNTHSLEFFLGKGTGTLMSHIMGDIDLLGNNLDFVATSLIQPMMILFTLGILFIIHPKMTLFALLFLPTTGLLVRELGKRVRAASRKRQIHMAEMSGILQETFSAVRVVKSFGMEDYETKRFSDEVMRFFRSTMRIVRAKSLAPVLTEVLGAFGVAIVLAGGTYFVLSESIPQEDRLEPETFFTYLTFLFVLYQPIKALSKVSITISNALAGAERVFGVLETEPTISDREGAVELSPFSDRIVYRDVVFEYPGGIRALDGVSVEIRKGETIALVGPSGAGKSTFVDLLTRFYDPAGGSITIDGHDLRDAKTASLRRQIGIVPQEVVLFNDTIRNNIAYGRPDLDQSVVISAAKEANAHDFIVSTSNGYDTVVGERGHALSGGQAQRISIARALVKDPPILIFDEATSSLDSESEKAIRTAMNNLIKDRTTIIIAHRLSTIMHADKIIVFDKGKVVGLGKHEEVLAGCPVYRRLYEHQFGNSDE